jgi:DNA-binding NarL/FixJ family response regulator
VARAGDGTAAAKAPSQAPAAALEALSRREREIAELVAEGRTNKQIAATLFISENTVESHLRRVFSKLGVSKRAALAAALTESRIHGFP